MIFGRIVAVATLLTFSTAALGQGAPAQPQAAAEEPIPAQPPAPAPYPASAPAPYPASAPAPYPASAPAPYPAAPPAAPATPVPHAPVPPTATHTVVCPVGTAPFMDPQLGSVRCLTVEEKTKPRVGLIIGGGIMFAVGYSIAFAIAAGTDYNDVSGFLAVPVVGPFITMARHDYGDCANSVDCAAVRVGDTFATIGLVLNFLLQAGGATMLIVGITVPKKEEVPQVSVGPMAVGSGVGLGATLSF